MRNLLTGSVAFLYYMVAFAAFGLLLPEKYRGKGPLGAVLWGFPLYYAVFEVVAIPCTLLGAALHVLRYIWIGILLLVALFVLMRRRPQLRSWKKSMFVTGKDRLFSVLSILFSVFAAVFLSFNINHLSYYDHSYYVGVAGSSVYSDTIEEIDVYTGMPGNRQKDEYMLNTDTTQNAVVCSMFGVHAMVHANASLSAVMILLFFGYLYMIGTALLSEQKWVFLFLLTTFFVLMFTYARAGTSMYFALRPYEGKSIESYLMTTAILAFYLIQYENEVNIGPGRMGLVLIGASSIAFTNSALFITPAMLSVLMLPYSVIKKEVRAFSAWLLAMIPCALYLALHVLL